MTYNWKLESISWMRKQSLQRSGKRSRRSRQKKLLKIKEKERLHLLLLRYLIEATKLHFFVLCCLHVLSLPSPDRFFCFIVISVVWNFVFLLQEPVKQDGNSDRDNNDMSALAMSLKVMKSDCGSYSSWSFSEKFLKFCMKRIICRCY